MLLNVLFFALTFLFFWILLKTSMSKKRAVLDRVGMLQKDTSTPAIYHRDEDMDPSLSRRLLSPIWTKLIERMEVMTPRGWKVAEQKRLNQSGMLGKMTMGEWLSWRFVSLVGGLILAFFIGWSMTGLAKIWVGGLLIFMGWYFPIYHLKKKAAERQKQITRSLPDVLDLLTVSVEAGLGFDAAVAKVVEKTDGALAEEFGKTLQEIRMGKGRRDALKDLGRRTGNADLLGFVSSIVQADQLGVSIGNVLRIQSEDLRGRRKARAEEQAMKAPIKILFPLIMFIFPSIFIIILGPAVLSIKNTLLK
jgi:tight adherence protein C